MADKVEFRDGHSTWTIAISDDSNQPQLRMARMVLGIEIMDRDFDGEFRQALGSDIGRAST